jgi:murein endopeptidase
MQRAHHRDRALAGHLSHRTGRDVDVGFYFTRMPDGYPDHFAAADGTLDLAATWALLVAFAASADQDSGIEIVFLDYAVQRRLYDFARARGTRDAELAFLLQYPRGKDALVGLVRHWPGHADHFHLRFKRR